MRLKPNVTSKLFDISFDIINENRHVIASVEASWEEVTNHIPATFDHADESETEIFDTQVEMSIETDFGNAQIILKDKSIPYDPYWEIMAHLDKFGHKHKVPDLMLNKSFFVNFEIGKSENQE